MCISSLPSAFTRQFSSLSLHTLPRYLPPNIQIPPLRTHRFVNPRTLRNTDMFTHIVFQRLGTRRAFVDRQGAYAWDVQGGGEEGVC